jgi:hypothetical protein
MGMRAVVVWLTLTAFVLCPLSALGKKKRKRKKGPRKPDPAIALEDPSYPRLDAHCAEDDALAVLAAGEAGWSDSYCADTVRRVMEKGWWEVSAHLVGECRARGFKVASPVYKAKSNLNKQLNVITNLLSGPSAVISPAFQWAQSRDYILINVKFAHKLDTPATLGVKSKGGADITEKGLVFEAASKTKNKRFRLDLKLSRAVVPEESDWSMAAVGRATISLKKKHPETAWIRLLDSAQVPPQNMHTWWTMREQHSNDIKTLDTSMTDASAIAKAKAKAAEEAKARNETEPSDGAEAAGTTAAASKGNAADNNNNNNQDASAAATEASSGSGTAGSTETATTAAHTNTPVDPMVEAKRKELMAERSEARAAILKEATDQVALVQQNKARALDKAEADFSAKLAALGGAGAGSSEL